MNYALHRCGDLHRLRLLGVQAEGAVPYAGLHQLMSPLRPTFDQLPERQARALRAALGSQAVAEFDPTAFYSGLLSFLLDLAKTNPLIIAVDDAHWLDRESLDALGFVARRIANEPIALLFAARSEEPFWISGIDEMNIGGLDLAAGVALVSSVAPTDLTPKVARLLVERTDGNPLALLELPTTLDADQRGGRIPVEDPLTVTASIERSFLGRAGGLSEAARSVLLLAAVGEADDLDAILASTPSAPTGLHEAEQADLLFVRHERLEFRHPLVRSAIYSAATESSRREAHAGLAAGLADRYPFRSAWHRAHAIAGPDETVAQVLVQYAEAAQRAGAAGTASRLFGYAAQKSADTEVRAERLLRSGEAAWSAGHSDLARELLEQAEGLTEDPLLAADIEVAKWWAVCSGADPSALFEPLVAAADGIAQLDPRRSAKMFAIASDYAFDVLDIDRARRLAARAERIIGEEGTAQDIEVLSALSWAWVADGRVAIATAAARRIFALLEGRADLQAAYACDVLTTADLHDEALVQLLPVITQSRRSGHIPVLSYSLASLALVELRRGNLARSLSAAMQALAITEFRPPWTPLLAAQAAESEAALGLAESCREHVRAACSTAWAGTGYAPARALAALGLLELGAGNIEKALAALNQAHGIAKSLRHPGFIRYAGDLIEALARAGDIAAATTGLADLEQRTEESGSGWGAHVAVRCRLLLAPEDQIHALYESSLLLSESPFEMARTALVFGERLRRSRSRVEARVPLQSSLDVFTALGAESWSEKARGELRATGMRLSREKTSLRSELTPQELRVALVVAEGVTNREASARLFLSEKTIEAHLSRTFRKLNVRSRTELARKLSLADPAVVGNPR